MPSKPERGNTMPYLHKSSGDQVELERYRWVAQYRDGSKLHQFDDDTLEFHQIKEIDQSQLHVFKLVGDQHTFTLIFNPDTMKLVHFYKNYRLNVGTDDEERFKWYVFGYEKRVAKHNEKVLIVITHLDEMVVTDDIANMKVA